MDLVQYINSDGFVTVAPNAQAVPGEGNGWLQTGLALATGKIPAAALEENLIPLLSRCQKSPTVPLIWRSPYKVNPGDETKQDDYYGALLISPTWAARLLDYLEAAGWDFDIGGKQRLEYRFDRFPDLAPLVFLAAGRDISIFDEVRLALTIVWDAFHIEQADANMRTYCKIYLAEKDSILCALAAKFWRGRVRARYGTIGASWAGYWGLAHPMNIFD